jgi:triosephosphate isomerase
VPRRPLLIANWKMYKTVPESTAFARELARRLDEWTGWDELLDVVLCPTAPALWSLHRVLARTGVGVGAQDGVPGTEGAMTGALSMYLVREAGAAWCLVGHSERRRLFGETDAVIGAKVAAAQAAGLCPVLCVGETAEERSAGATDAVVRRQLDVLGDEPGSLVVAYEPVWAIGTGLTADPEEVGRVAALVRTSLTGRWGTAGGAVRVLYGGSVSAATLGGFLAQPSVDGALVGGASLRLDEFWRLARIAAEAAPSANPPSGA